MCGRSLKLHSSEDEKEQAGAETAVRGRMGGRSRHKSGLPSSVYFTDSYFTEQPDTNLFSNGHLTVAVALTSTARKRDWSFAPPPDICRPTGLFPLL